jgi:hypothetical protein
LPPLGNKALPGYRAGGEWLSGNGAKALCEFNPRPPRLFLWPLAHWQSPCLTHRWIGFDSQTAYFKGREFFSVCHPFSDYLIGPKVDGYLDEGQLVS